MARKNFFERMEREINFKKEYQKIEDIILNEYDRNGSTIEEEISSVFRNWPGRGNYTSFYELREELGFPYYQTGYRQYETNCEKIIDIKQFLLYCEMTLNMFSFLSKTHATLNEDRICAIIDTINFDLDKINHKAFIDKNQRIFIVQKDAAATAVADVVETDLGDAIILYNHHLLKGDIEEKKAILKKIADALEPKRAELKVQCSEIENNFFYMVNNFNIRHNNCEPSDKSKYNEMFASLSSKEQEDWYDDIYQEGLMAFLSLEHTDRNEKIKEFRRQCKR